MEGAEITRALAAASSIATSAGLQVDDTVVLNNSNKLTARLLPADVLARIAPAGEQVAEFEVDLARRLARSGSPVATVDPRVDQPIHCSDGFVITLWTYYPPEDHPIGAAEYADALWRLHLGMRDLVVPAPHFTDRVESALVLVTDPELTPELPDAGRHLLAATLNRLGGSVAARGGEQLLHGEPHPGNLLSTSTGPRFVDFETLLPRAGGIRSCSCAGRRRRALSRFRSPTAAGLSPADVGDDHGMAVGSR
ncbi:phosphotransferase [Microlunatus sp. Gsoil 973]|uniref:phosphotransferase n=1 Tax=Microlunatus sp. Gsoil 973 TaxID=2672569 RepID=UPI001E3C83F8|nr:phosphotransferase [Microlunatus sp. Gsoil 973]